MGTNQRTRPAWSVAGGAFALMSLVVGVALAAAPATTAYHFSEHPMIAGTVVSVNDHQMIVNTDQGEQVTLELDSRTMAPRDLEPGMVMRAEFLALENCRLYAQRILPVRSGMSLNRLQAYANPAGDQPAAAGNWTSTHADAGEPAPGATMRATPSTRGYRHSTRPMISGKVVAVNDHFLRVETDQGQQVGLIMDSRTMVPAEVAPGATVRAEFIRMKDGRCYAQRVGHIVGGTANREQAYANTRDTETMIASLPDECGFVSAAGGEKVTSAPESGRVDASQPVAARNVPERATGNPETLPQTASRQPLLLLLGLSALATAGLLTAARGSRNV